jgi:lipopolysaccharide transport system permease protein
MSLGLWLSALNAHYRDFGYIVPFLLQLGLIISPVVYQANVPSHWRWLYFLNPMAALLDTFRWSILGTTFPGWDAILISSVSTLLLLVSGAWYFHRVDRFMADNI